jgi:hypothetical protein
MEPALENPYGSFRAPRVPLDLRCIALGAAGWGVLQLADGWLGRLFSSESPLAQLMGLLSAQLGRVAFLGDAFDLSAGALWGVAPFRLTWWQGATAALVFFAVWSIIGGALLRVSALRLTRNLPLRPKEALRFGFANATTLLLIPVLIAVFVAALVALNALAGLVMSLWFVGSSVLALVLFPLVLLSSLLIVLAIVGGLVGLPLMWAGATVERNGALESVSRSFSYVSARPFHFFFAYLLLFVLMSAITVIEGHFEDIAKSSLKAGIVRTELDDAVSRPPPRVGALEEPLRDHETVRRRVRGIADVRNIGEVAWYDQPGFIWMWILLSVFLLGFKGYVIYLFLGGSMSLYLLLRREVDGTHEDELAQSEEIEAPRDEADRARWVGKPEEETSAEEP